MEIPIVFIFIPMFGEIRVSLSFKGIFFLFVDTCKATLKDLLVSFLHSEKKKVALGKILEVELGVCKSALPASLGPGALAAQELVSKESILQCRRPSHRDTQQ